MSGWIMTILFIWAVCGVLAFGTTFGHFQRKYALIADEQYRSDITFAVFIGLTGPIGLVVAAFMGRFEHGVKFK